MFTVVYIAVFALLAVELYPIVKKECRNKIKIIVRQNGERTGTDRSFLLFYYRGGIEK